MHVNMSFWRIPNQVNEDDGSVASLEQQTFLLHYSFTEEEGGGESFSARIRSPCEPPSARVGIRPFRGIPFTILERWIFLFECCASNIIFMKIMFSPLDTNPPSAECLTSWHRGHGF